MTNVTPLFQWFYALQILIVTLLNHYLRRYANEKFIETNASLQHRSNEHVLQYQQQNHAINTYHGNLRFCACVYPAETSLN